MAGFGCAAQGQTVGYHHNRVDHQSAHAKLGIETRNKAARVPSSSVLRPISLKKLAFTLLPPSDDADPALEQRSARSSSSTSIMRSSCRPGVSCTDHRSHIGSPASSRLAPKMVTGNRALQTWVARHSTAHATGPPTNTHILHGELALPTRSAIYAAWRARGH